MWGLGGQNFVEVSMRTRIVLLPDIRLLGRVGKQSVS